MSEIDKAENVLDKIQESIDRIIEKEKNPVDVCHEYKLMGMKKGYQFAAYAIMNEFDISYHLEV